MARIRSRVLSERQSCDPDWLPPKPVAAGLLVIMAVALLHFLLLTPLTYNLDDVKHVSMWIGGGLGLTIFALLAMRDWIRFPPKTVWIPGLAYLGILVLSTLAASEDYARWIGWDTVVMYVCLAGFFLLGTVVGTSERLARWGVRYWVLTGLVVCGIGLLHYGGIMEHIEASMRSAQSAREKSSHLYNLVKTFASQREMFSTILNTQFFGVFLSLIVPICLAGIVLEHERMHEASEAGTGVAGPASWMVMAGLTAIFAVFCIFMTYSKTALGTIPVALVGFLVPVHLMTRYKVLRVPAWPVALGLSLLAAAILVYFVLPDLRQRISSLDVSTGSRGMIWGGAWNIFLDHPILGSGPGSFRFEFPLYRSPDYHLSAVSNLTLYAHNLFLDVLSETGILGFLTYVAFLAGLFGNALLGIRKTESDRMRVMTIAFVVGVACLLLGNMATPMMRWHIGAVEAFLAYGMLAGVGQLARQGNLTWDSRRLFNWGPRSFAGAAAAGLLLVWTIFMAQHSYWFMKASYRNNEGIKGNETATNLAPRMIEDPIQLYNTQLRLLTEAAEHFEKAIEWNPTFVTSYYKLAHTYNNLANAERARFERLRTEAREDGEVSPGETEEMREVLSKSIELQHKSLEAYDQLQEYAPNYSEVHLNRAIVHLSLGRTQKVFADVLASESATKRNYLEQAEENYRLATEYIATATEQSNKVSVHFLEGAIRVDYAELMGRDSLEYSEEMRLAALAFRRTRDLPYSHFIQEDDQLERERREKEISSQRAPAIFSRIAEHAEAAKDFSWLAGENPGQSRYHILAAMQWKEAGMPAKAKAQLEEGLQRNPLDPDLRLARVELLAGLASSPGDWEEVAEQAYEVRTLAEFLPEYLNPAQQNIMKRALRTARLELGQASSQEGNSG